MLSEIQIELWLDNEVYNLNLLKQKYDIIKQKNDSSTINELLDIHEKIIYHIITIKNLKIILQHKEVSNLEWNALSKS